MIKKEEISKSDWESMKIHKQKTDYNQDEINDLINLIRLYVNPSVPGCVTCHNNLRQAKNELNEFVATNFEYIEQLFKTHSDPEPDKQEEKEILNDSIKQVEEYTETTEKEQSKRKKKKT